MHVVVFPGWYPNRYDGLSGDFTQRHLHAIARYCDVTAIIPIKDNTLRRTEEDIRSEGRLTERYIYYPAANSRWFENALSYIRYNYICLREIHKLKKKKKVDLVHLYVLQKNHLTGVLLKWVFGIPYVISEHSTMYVTKEFNKIGRIRRALFKYAFNKALSYHGVSQYLTSTIKDRLQLQKDGVVIPNVVNTDVFFPKPHHNQKVTFVHVSNMVYQKNIKGMLQGFAVFRTLGGNYHLNLVGPIPGDISDLIKALHLEEYITIWGERSYEEVANIMQQSDCLVLFTRYETFGCVIIEANACGLPALVTDLPVTHELVTKEVNGLFVANEDVEDLYYKLKMMSDSISTYSQKQIASYTHEKFSYNKVGQVFAEWYRESLSNR